MYVYINNEGIATTIIPHGEPFRQGSTLNLFLCFEQNATYPGQTIPLYSDRVSFKIGIKKPENDKHVLENYVAKYVNKSFVFKKLHSAEQTFDLVDGKSYLVYNYSFSPELVSTHSGMLEIYLGARLTESEDEYQYNNGKPFQILVEKVWGNNASLGHNLTPSDYANLENQIRAIESKYNNFDLDNMFVKNISFNGTSFIVETTEPRVIGDETSTIFEVPVKFDEGYEIKTLDVDTIATKDSTNLITSGAVFSAMSGNENGRVAIWEGTATSGTTINGIFLDPNKIYLIEMKTEDGQIRNFVISYSKMLVETTFDEVFSGLVGIPMLISNSDSYIQLIMSVGLHKTPNQNIYTVTYSNELSILGNSSSPSTPDITGVASPMTLTKIIQL